MTNSSGLSARRWLPVALLILSLVGFVDATYLTVVHYTGANLPCRIFDGCDTVTTSPYSMLGPLPVALLGMLFYLTIFVLTLAYLLHRRSELTFLMVYASLAAFLFSLYFTALQMWIIKAICLYCVTSATLATLIFVLAIILRRRRNLGPSESGGRV